MRRFGEIIFVIVAVLYIIFCIFAAIVGQMRFSKREESCLPGKYIEVAKYENKKYIICQEQNALKFYTKEEK